DYERGQRLTADAERTTSQPETRLLAKGVRAVSDIERESPKAMETTVRAFEAARSMGVFDPFVVTYRAFPKVLCRLINTRVQGHVARLLKDVGDEELGHQIGILERAGPQRLSPREREVLELLGRGRSHRSIA